MRLIKATVLTAWMATLLLGGCAIDGPDDFDNGLDDGIAEGDEGTEVAWDAAGFNRHHVAETAEITDWDTMTVAEVQAFLDNNPYGWTSVLASYSSNGKTAAEAIVHAAQTYRINPIAILTRTQMEQSLIGKTTASNKALNYAMGCGCPDNQPCNPVFKGFDKQVVCMASKYRSYLDDMENQGSTIAGWGVGITKTTLDSYSVTPDNAATAALYTYTPWVFAQKSHDKIWSLYTQFLGYTGPSTPIDPDPPITPLDIIIDDNNGNNGPNAEFVASAEWTSSSYTSGYHGSGYNYRSTGNSSGVASFRVFLEQAASVTVEAWWTAGGNRSQTAPFIVYDADGNNLGVSQVNQQQNGSQWIELGSYNMSAGWNTVALSRWTSAGYVVVADAVRVRTTD